MMNQMATCHCGNYTASFLTYKDLKSRIQQRDQIMDSLTLLASTPGYDLYQCRNCIQYWQATHWEHWGWLEGHQDRIRNTMDEVLYPVPSIDPEEWKLHPYPDLCIAEAEERSRRIRRVFETLGAEIGPRQCEIVGCSRLRIARSAFCRRHHVEDMQGKGILPAWFTNDED